MEIYNLIRGHFAVRTGRTYKTPIQNKNFSIDSVGEWQIVLNLSTGKTANVYMTDILRVYTFIVSSYKDLKFSEVDQFIESNCIRKRAISYILPLIETFSDIQIVRQDELIIRFIQLPENA
ncbi:MAG: hypothetical protein JSS81_05500 [Acidobacteria bacterium]|nr:hypothetical protein [Acidobacteriota bacterium]